MEKETKIALTDALKAAYQGMIDRGDRSDTAFEESIDPLLVGVSDEDRLGLSNKLYYETVRQRMDHVEGTPSYLGLAWHIHSWSSGS